ncbi:methyltransferase domain-containing protein [Chloroflexota bacterium]
MGNADRINEVYYGKILSKKAHAIAQERVAWICGRVRGSKVLDIGCSQGIVSILLARVGKKVTGIDINGDSIEYAKKELAAESDSTREQLNFIYGDTLQQGFEENSFDTVIMGQFIEHVPEPEAFLELARRVCKPDGRVIITTPHGLLDSPEHIHTFYLYHFCSIVSPFFAFKELDIVGKRICFLGDPKKDRGTNEYCAKPVIDEQWHMRIHELSESEFGRVEKEKHEQLSARTRRMEKLQSKIEDLENDKQTLQSRIENLENNKQTLQSKIEDLENDKQTLQSRIENLENDKQTLQSKIEDLENDKQTLQSRIENLENDKQTLQSRIENLENDKQTLRSRISGLKNDKQTLQSRVIDLKNSYSEKNKALHASLRFRLAEALASAVPPSIATLALPFRLWRIYRDHRSRKQQPVLKSVPTENSETVFHNPAPIVESVTLQNEQREKIEKGRILFVPTNGAGLGHLTRMLAIARRLKTDHRIEECVFLTTSNALNIIGLEGFITYHFPPPALLKKRINSMSGNSCLCNLLTMVMDNHEINTFIFDGVNPYSGIIDAIVGRKNLLKVWVKRGMMKEGIEERFRIGEKYFDLQLVPGELGQKGIIHDSTERIVVPPIVFLDRKELLPREDVIAKLGLNPTKKTVFVQLGSGNKGDHTTEIEMIIDTLRQFDSVQVVLSQSLISKNDMYTYEDIKILKDYPNSRYYMAFDLAISASGYNTFNELMYFGIPSIFVPSLAAGADDQAGRAMIAQQAGTGLFLSPLTASGLKECLEKLLDDTDNAIIRKRCLNLCSINGSDIAAQVLTNYMFQCP